MTDEITESVLGAAIEVHKALGPGLLESVYEECLALELKLRSLDFQRQLSLPIAYKGNTVNAAYRIDFLVGKAWFSKSRLWKNWNPYMRLRY